MVRAHRVRALRYTRPDAEICDGDGQAGATGMPAHRTTIFTVLFAQQNAAALPKDVPFGAMFDTELSRKWNVSQGAPRRGKRITCH